MGLYKLGFLFYFNYTFGHNWREKNSQSVFVLPKTLKTKKKKKKEQPKTIPKSYGPRLNIRLSALQSKQFKSLLCSTSSDSLLLHFE